MSALTELDFAAKVDALAADGGRRAELIALLREDHPCYDQRGTAATVRMRGWVMLALARLGVSDAELLYVLEELDTGVEPYLVTAAAVTLRSYRQPEATFAPFIMRALANIRFREEPVCFERYGEYADSDRGTSPVRELLAALEWLGPQARAVRDEIEALRRSGGLPKKMHAHVARVLRVIDRESTAAPPPLVSCCGLPAGFGNFWKWDRGLRQSCADITRIVFEDHDGAKVVFGEFFRGKPSVVAFFYTRCDNPLKCSLTVTKLGRLQRLLDARGLAHCIQTAAISYDPAYDLPNRLRIYGKDRAVRMDGSHRLLRTVDGIEPLRRHFKLGVNFIQTLVNRHRIELFILDAEGQIASTFARIRWDEEKVVDRAVEVLREGKVRKVGSGFSENPPGNTAPRWLAAPVVGTLSSVGVAFFPKCPFCWAGYLSLFGIAGLERIPFTPWLEAGLLFLMLLNLGSVWLRGRVTGRMAGFYFVCTGTFGIGVSRVDAELNALAVAGVALILGGSLLSTLGMSIGGRQSPNRMRPMISQSSY